jgi:hypothetical protein
VLAAARHRVVQQQRRREKVEDEEKRAEDHPRRPDSLRFDREGGDLTQDVNVQHSAREREAFAAVPNRAARVGAIAFAAYAAIAIVITFPLIATPTRHFPGRPGDNDVFGFIWNNWWVSHAVLRLHQSPFVTDYLFAPFEIDLRLHTFGALYGLLAIPVTAAGGPVLALNLQIFGTVALNGLSAFVLARYLTSDDRAAFLAGLVVAATPAINFHLVMGRVSCAAVWPAVLSLLFFLQLVERPRLSRAGWLILSLYATLAVDQQIALFGLVWIIILACARATFRVSQITDPKFLAAAALVIAGAAPAAYWLYVQPFVGQAGHTVPAAAEAATYSYPASLLWTPAMIWPVYGTVIPAGLLAGLVVAVTRASILPWLLGAFLCVALSLGPSDGDAAIISPFGILQRLPGMAQFRTPYRFQIPAAIGGAMGVASAVTWLAARVRRRNVLAVLVGAVALFDLTVYKFVYGFPLQTRHHHPVYASLADGRDARPILEVPVGVRTGTDLIGTGETLSFHQSIHQRRLINGMIARVPLEALHYYRRSPALMFLADQTDAPVAELHAI